MEEVQVGDTTLVQAWAVLDLVMQEHPIFKKRFPRMQRLLLTHHFNPRL